MSHTNLMTIDQQNLGFIALFHATRLHPVSGKGGSRQNPLNKKVHLPATASLVCRCIQVLDPAMIFQSSMRHRNHMRIASWNVNSIRARLEPVTRWLEESKPEVLLLQELKGSEFPTA